MSTQALHMAHGPGTLHLLLLVAIAAMSAPGCGGGSGVGATCGDDADCGYGLQCFLPADADGPVCTISCQQVSCNQGVCIQSKDGFLCAPSCDLGDTCDTPSLSCQLTASDEKVCWYEDPHLDALPDGLMPAPIQVRDDTNGDGALNPTETAIVDVYVENLEDKALSGLWAELVDSEQGVDVQVCKMPASPTWLTCSEYCSCQQHAMQSGVSAAPGGMSEDPILSMEVQLSGSATGTLEVQLIFHDNLGRTWERAVDLPVVDL